MTINCQNIQRSLCRISNPSILFPALPTTQPSSAYPQAIWSAAVISLQTQNTRLASIGWMMGFPLV